MFYWCVRGPVACRGEMATQRRQIFLAVVSGGSMAARGSSGDPKVTALRESRCLNPHPDRVTDEAFLAEEFFDARDAVQVKYEMVRRVSVDGAPVTATAAAFG